MKPHFFYKLDYESFVCLAIGKSDMRLDTFDCSWTWGYHYTSQSIDSLRSKIQSKDVSLLTPVYK